MRKRDEHVETVEGVRHIGVGERASERGDEAGDGFGQSVETLRDDWGGDGRREENGDVEELGG